jgi:TetR/AcrR family transcriptional repressor of bet genes
VLAREGYSETTLADVAREAGISQGLVNFHFESKGKLLSQTLLFMADEYRQNWTRALSAAPDRPALQLAAMMSADFDAAICTPERLACWCSYWGEVQSRPIYQQECAANDDTYIRTLEGLCAKIIDEGGYSVEPVRAARILRFTSEGLWNDMLSMTTPYSRAEALRTLYSCAAVLFPAHFTVDGANKMI